MDLDSRTPGPGRTSMRLGLISLRSALSRLAGRIWRWIAQEGDAEVVEERFWLHTRDAERGRGATDATDGGRVVGRGSSVDRHSQFVRQLALHFSCEECGDAVCSRAQVAFSLEPGHPTHLARRVRWGPDGAGEVASRSSPSFPANWWVAPSVVATSSLCARFTGVTGGSESHSSDDLI